MKRRRSVDIRPLRPEEARAADACANAAFDDLDRRLGRPPDAARTQRAVGHALTRIEHLITTDPGGAWAAEADGRVVGVALALVRDGLWGLSLFTVHPEHRGTGIGRGLLEAALGHGPWAGGIVLSSLDPAAIRCYALAGFELRPLMAAAGKVGRRNLGDAPGVRPGGPGDFELAAAVDRAVRGAPHGPDLQAMLDADAHMLVAPDAGYAFHRDGRVLLLAARDEESAQRLLRAALAATPKGLDAHVDFVSGEQRWAFPVLLEADLALRADGPLFVRGEVGPLHPYLPSGAYL